MHGVCGALGEEAAGLPPPTRFEHITVTLGKYHPTAMEGGSANIAGAFIDPGI
ncbi:hypothetical protein GCM10007082_14510 [Oceanisphaera arctica]|nr:hypothetical protein GCM10007082_14510 [Oceanisphaera arctica]